MSSAHPLPDTALTQEALDDFITADQTNYESAETDQSSDVSNGWHSSSTEYSTSTWTDRPSDDATGLNNYGSYETKSSLTDQPSDVASGWDTPGSNESTSTWTDQPSDVESGSDATSSYEPTSTWTDQPSDDASDWAVEQVPALRWTSPLPTSPKPLIFKGGLRVVGHPFLTAFLEKDREIDIPFAIFHRLATFLMHMAEESCFDFIARVNKVWLEDYQFNGILKRDDLYARYPVSSADQIELYTYGNHLEKNLYTYGRHMAGENPSIPKLDAIRLLGVHSWAGKKTVYIEMVVYLLALLQDERRLSQLEQVLEVIYRRYQPQDGNTKVISDEEDAMVNLALGYIPSPVKTAHQLIYQIQDIVEKCCFDFWTKHRPESLLTQAWSFNTFQGDEPRTVKGTGWDCPERVELNMWQEVTWDFPELFSDIDDDEILAHDPADGPTKSRLLDLLESMRFLRNNAAHRGIAELNVQLPNASSLARLLGDQAAADQIDAMVAEAETMLRPIFEYNVACRKKRDEENLRFQLMNELPFNENYSE